MQPKITLVGAGSVVFSKRLISDILQFPELAKSTISLMDIDPQRLKVAEIMTRKIAVALKNTQVRIEATLDQRRAIRDANYVICTIQVGGYKPATVIDFEIPRKYGVFQTIGDTLGVGGMFRALRTIPVMNSIARDIAEVGARGCLLLNYTNPMAMNCWGVAKGVGIPHVGLCHSVQATSKRLAFFAGLPYEEVRYLAAGLNHMAFFLKFEYHGQDAYPLLFRALESDHFKRDKVRFEIMRRTGYFVTESSEHQSEYTPYFIHHGEKVIQEFDVPINEYLRRCEATNATWKETEAKLLGGDGRIEVYPQSHEYGSYIIHSCETDIPRVIYGNVPNRGLISNLPAGCCVEVPCLVNGLGIQPTRIGDLPPQLAAICRTNANVQELTVEAALTKKREHIYHALMFDPHTASVLTLDKIWKMCDELIAAHQKHGFLGEFSPVIRNTGRGFAGVGDRVMMRLEEVSGSRKGDKLGLRLRIENPRQKPVNVDVEMKSAKNHFEILGKKKFSIRVPGGKTIYKPVLVRCNSETGRGGRIQLSTRVPYVFTQDFITRARHQLAATADQPASFDLELDGNPAVEGKISSTGTAIKIWMRVYDSKIEPKQKAMWHGSCVELFFAQDSSSPVHQFFCLPQKNKVTPRIVKINLNRGPKLEPKIPAKQRLTANSYELNLEIPYAALQFRKPVESFLFDTTANLMALGDAHGGGRVLLSGSYESFRTSDHYAVVQLA